MQKKQKSEPKQTTQKVKFRFICEKLVNYGQAVFISGSIPQIGSWKLENAIKLTCYDIEHWVIDLQIPVETQIQFKYFVSEQQNISPVYWVGNQTDENFKLLITKQDAKQIQLEKKTRDLKTMSFNIRGEKDVDKNQFSWDIRKINCLKVIKQRFPSIIGIQECSMNQRNYLEKSLQPYYKYVGFSDTNKNDREVGIFYDKQRFVLIESGFRFICQTNKSDNCPSQFSFAVLQDTYNSERFLKTLHPQGQKSVKELPRQLFLVENIYLSYNATKSQQQCMEMIMEEIKTKRKQYKDDIRDVFILGDFNLPENSHLLHSLQKSEFNLESIRKNLLRRHLKEQCDLGYTFNAFEHDQYDVQNPKKIIDHLYVASKDYEPTRFEVVRELADKGKHSKAQVISDHFPIMGVFKHKRNKSSSKKMIK